MNDAAPTPATDELPELPSETAGAASGSRRRRALWGALVAIAVGVGAIAVQASDDDAPRLPLALGASAANKEAAAPSADMSMRAFVRYTAGDDLPTLGDGGPAYRLSDTADEAAVRRLAGAFGLDDELEREGDVWRATDGTHSMEVYPGFGAGWWFGPQDATKSSEPSVGIRSGGGSESGFACPEPLDAAGRTAEACMPSTTTSTISPDLPSKDEARTIAVDVLDRAGVETDGAKITVDGPYDGWYVTIEPELDGLPTGMISSVTVGDDGEVLFASGVLTSVTKVGDYATVDTREAIDRLNDGYGGVTGAAYPTAGDVGMTDIAVEEGTPGSTVAEECVASSDGRESCTYNSVPPVCPDPALATTTIPAPDAMVDSTSTTGGIPEPAIAPDGPCGAPVPVEPQEPIEVVLHDAEPILMLVGSTDGADDGYLVPGYRFTGDDGVVVDQMAIADDALEPVDPSGDTPTAPAPGPATGSGSTSSDPGVSGGGSPGYDPDGSVSSPVQPAPGTITPTGPTTPCTLPEPGPNGEVPAIACADAPTP